MKEKEVKRKNKAIPLERNGMGRLELVVGVDDDQSFADCCWSN